MTKVRIDALSPTQEQLLQQLVSSLRIDAVPRESAMPGNGESAIRRIYQALGLPRPHVVWCDNPFQLSVMPILLELLVQHEERTGYSRLLGELDENEKELKDLLTRPRWQDALKSLLQQCPPEVLSGLAHDETEKIAGLDDLYKQYGWSKCGLPASELIWNQARKHIAHIVQSLERYLTLSLAARLTNSLYTVPNDQAQRVKRMVGQILVRHETLRLRDEPLTVFGSAQTSLVGLYQRASEFLEQLKGTRFVEMLRAIPAPQADPAYVRRPRNLQNDETVNTAAVLAFGPYQTLWGAWASFATTCYSTIAQLYPGEVEDDARYFLSDLSTFLRSGFAYSALTRVVFIWKFPLHVQVDEQQRLHNEHGSALLFRGGYKIFALRGVAVPPELVEQPELLTAKAIEVERNVELRRIMIDRYGAAKYLRDTGAGIMDKSHLGTLYLKQLPGDEALAMVQVRNSTPEPDGTFKDYFLRVPPTCRTAREAVAWTFGLRADEYDPAQES